jgi:TolB-like protein/AraC-like DNA-binding protein
LLFVETDEIPGMRPSIQETLVEKIRQEIDDNLTNDQFGVEQLARNIGISRSQLHRKVHALTGKSVSQFIREHRLALAKNLLMAGTFTAAEIADRTGFRSASYFSKCFADCYGVTPGEVKHQALTPTDAPENGRDAGDPVRGFRIPLPARRMGKVAAILLIPVVLYLLYAVIQAGAGKGDPMSAYRSVAILPFKNLSGSDDQYFCEGMVEAIRTRMSQIGDLRVISGTSVEQYREGAKSARAIANELAVFALLEGSIQRNGHKVRVEVRLIDGRTEGQIWASSYDRSVEDVFVIQSEIARQIAGELHAKLSPEDERQLLRTETINSDAYNLYLKARYEYSTYTNQGAHNAIALLTQAVTLDTGYARAYAFLGNSYFGLATIWGAELSALEALQKGKPFVENALDIDKELDEAHMLMGFYHLYHDWNFAEADQAYQKSIVADHPDALALYIDFLNFMSRHAEALELADRLNEKHPYYPNSRKVYTLFYNGRFEEAMEFSASRLRLFSNYNTFDAHGFLMLNLGNYSEAISTFNKAIALEGKRYPRMLAWMGAAYAKSGDRAEAFRIVDELEARLKGGESSSIAFFIAVVHAALNQKADALAWLKKAYESHDMEMPWVMTEPQFYGLHQEQEFIEIASQIGFPLRSHQE